MSPLQIAGTLVGVGGFLCVLIAIALVAAAVIDEDRAERREPRRVPPRAIPRFDERSWWERVHGAEVAEWEMRFKAPTFEPRRSRR